MTDLAGRPVIVLGATGALGDAVCTAFLDADAVVHGFARTEPPDPRDGVIYHLVDVTDDAAVGSAFDAVGTPWAVVNTVGGFAPASRLSDLDVDQLTAQLELNLVSAAVVTKHALRRLASAGEGRLIHTASRSALQTDGVGFAYSVSKLGVLHLVEMAAREVRGTAITVNAVVPSVIDTPANRAALAGADHARWPKLEEVAAVYRFLATPSAQLISGAAVPVYGRT